MLTLVFAGCGINSGAGDMSFSGTVEVTEHALGAKVAGRLITLNADEGQAVRQGDLVATLDRFEQNKRDYERLRVLAKQGAATQKELEHAALAVDDQQIISPVDGVVLVKVHETGETLTAGSPVVVVGDRSNLWVRVYVPEGKINRIKPGQEAELTFDGIKEKFRGHVILIAPRAEFTPRNVQTAEERITRTFGVKVIIDRPPDYLRPGVNADVVIHTQG